MPVTAEAVTLVLSTIDRIKAILEAIETEEREPEGDDVTSSGSSAPGRSAKLKPQSLPWGSR